MNSYIIYIVSQFNGTWILPSSYMDYFQVEGNTTQSSDYRSINLTVPWRFPRKCLSTPTWLQGQFH